MFHDIQFPTNISYGSSGGASYSTNIIEQDSGLESRNSRWSSGKHKYDAAKGIQSMDDMSAVISFVHARKGSAYAFRWKDWADYSTASNHRNPPASTDQLIGTGDGTTTQFQIIKTYSDAAGSTTRTITKPVNATVLVSLDGVLQTTGYSVDYLTGIVTFVTPPGVGVLVKVGCYFDVPCRFGKEVDDGLKVSLEAYDAGAISSIPVIEVTDSTVLDDSFLFRGSVDRVIGATVALNATAFIQNISASTTGLKALLPDPDLMPAGGPHMIVYNVGSNSFDLAGNTGTTIVTLSAGTSAECHVAIDGASAQIWITR